MCAGFSRSTILNGSASVISIHSEAVEANGGDELVVQVRARDLGQIPDLQCQTTTTTTCT